MADRLPDGALQRPDVHAGRRRARSTSSTALTGWADGDGDRPGRAPPVRRGDGRRPRRSACAMDYDGVDQVIDGLDRRPRPRRRGPALRRSASPAAPSPAATRCGAPAPPPWAMNVTTCLVTLRRPAARTSPAWAGPPEGKRWLVVTVLPGAPDRVRGTRRHLRGGRVGRRRTSSTAQEPGGESTPLNDAAARLGASRGPATTRRSSSSRSTRRPGDRPVRGPHAALTGRDRGDHGQEGQPRDDDQDVRGARRPGRLRLTASRLALGMGEC